MTGSLRGRVAVFGAVLVLAAAGTGGYLWTLRRPDTAPAAPGGAGGVVDVGSDPAELAAVRAGPHLVFRNTLPQTGYGRVAVVPLAAPGGHRVLTPVSCDRVYATAVNAICLASERGLVTTYRARLLDAAWRPVRDLPLAGVPSRARISADGRLVATTSFVLGDSYAAPGQFSTRTVLSHAHGEPIGDLERFRLVVDGAEVTAADRNLWGVTFADADRFYATAASGGRTWLVAGSISRRTLTALRADAECPSLSPDGRRIVYKKRGDLPPGRWRLAVYDLASGAETLLAETRSVDDQVEWLDDRHVVYGLPRTGDSIATSDVWRVPADGTGAPELLIPHAWSPAVVR